MKGITLNDTGDITITPHRNQDGKMTGFVLSNTEIQNAAIVLSLNQGELKEDPVLGPNLYQLIRSRVNKSAVQKRIRVNLIRARVDYDSINESIGLTLKTI